MIAQKESYHWTWNLNEWWCFSWTTQRSYREVTKFAARNTN